MCIIVKWLTESLLDYSMTDNSSAAAKCFDLPEDTQQAVFWAASWSISRQPPCSEGTLESVSVIIRISWTKTHRQNSTLIHLWSYTSYKSASTQPASEPAPNVASRPVLAVAPHSIKTLGRQWPQFWHRRRAQGKNLSGSPIYQLAFDWCFATNIELQRNRIASMFETDVFRGFGFRRPRASQPFLDSSHLYCTRVCTKGSLRRVQPPKLC